MKQFFLIALLCVLTLGLCACSMCATPQTTVPATTPATVPVTSAPAPTSVATMPTVDSNIPDPSVDPGTSGMDEVLPTDGTADDDTSEPMDTVPETSGMQQSRSRRRGY